MKRLNLQKKFVLKLKKREEKRENVDEEKKKT